MRWLVDSLRPLRARASLAALAMLAWVARAPGAGDGYLAMDRVSKLARLGFSGVMMRMAGGDKAPIDPSEGDESAIGAGLREHARRGEEWARAEEEYRKTLARSQAGFAPLPEHRLEVERARVEEREAAERRRARAARLAALVTETFPPVDHSRGIDAGGLVSPRGDSAPAPEVRVAEPVDATEPGVDAFMARVDSLTGATGDPRDAGIYLTGRVATGQVLDGAEAAAAVGDGLLAQGFEEVGPDAFLARTEALVAAVDTGFGDPGEGLPADVLPEGDEPADVFVSPEELVADLVGGDRGGVFRQRVAAGFLTTEFGSVSEGNTTTESKYLTHYASYEKGVGANGDILLTNEVTLDTLRNAEVFDALYSHQIGYEGWAEANANVKVHQQKLGEPEPDYTSREVAIAGGRDAFPNWSLDGRIYTRTQEYGTPDTFYLDFESKGIEVGGRVSEEGVDIEYRLNWDEERYPGFAENDVNRLFEQWNVFHEAFASRWHHFDVSYTNTHQREGVLFPGILDSYDEWYQELVMARRISPVFAIENAYTRQSRHVDLVSAFLFDAREYGKRRKLTFRPSEVFDGALTLRNASLRNRDKDIFDATDEKAEDQERDDWELYLHTARGKLDATLTLYWGETLHVRGESVAFPDQERFGYAFTFVWEFTDSWRLNFNASGDEEEHPRFRENNVEATSVGAYVTYSF